jgi:hypothetical protein
MKGGPVLADTVLHLRVGDTVPVKFRGTKIPPTTARVVAIDGGLVHLRYRDGVFKGLRGLLRLPGWWRR